MLLRVFSPSRFTVVTHAPNATRDRCVAMSVIYGLLLAPSDHEESGCFKDPRTPIPCIIRCGDPQFGLIPKRQRGVFRARPLMFQKTVRPSARALFPFFGVSTALGFPSPENVANTTQLRTIDPWLAASLPGQVKAAV